MSKTITKEMDANVERRNTISTATIEAPRMEAAHNIQSGHGIGKKANSYAALADEFMGDDGTITFRFKNRVRAKQDIKRIEKTHQKE